METPDANGYINVNWPSKNIPHGGIFHTRTKDFSTAEKSFLKLLLDESKFTAQLRKSEYKLREKDEENKHKETRKLRDNVVMVRPRTSRRRSLSAIRASGIFEMNPYMPLKRGEDREKLKDKLADFMAYGDKGQEPPRPPRLIKMAPTLPTNQEKWNNLVSQIRERVDWLAEMEALGEADGHREIIQDQIAERMRALDALGVESECSSAKSRRSGFSVIDTARRSVRSGATDPDTVRSKRSTSSQGKVMGRKDTTKKNKGEENVEAYSRLSPLQYTPRRRTTNKWT